MNNFEFILSFIFNEFMPNFPTEQFAQFFSVITERIIAVVNVILGTCSQNMLTHVLIACSVFYADSNLFCDYFRFPCQVDIQWKKLLLKD